MTLSCNHSKPDFLDGVEAGLVHHALDDFYYPGLTSHEITWEPLQKDLTINSSGRVGTGYLAEKPIDKYMQQLIGELIGGIGFSATDQKSHIENVLQRFTDRRFQTREWWKEITESEVLELMSEIRAFYGPQTALLEKGLSDAFLFGKFGKLMTDSTSLAQARKFILKQKLGTYDKHRISYCKKFAGVFWDKAIARQTDSAKIKILEYNRDITTGIIENPSRKSLRSLTTDLYHSINKDNNIVLRDLDRIIVTETAGAQNYGVVSSGFDRGDQSVIIHVRPTACPKCKKLYLDEKGNPKQFPIKLLMMQSRDVNWGKKKGDELVPQMPPLHPHCFCRAYTI